MAAIRAQIMDLEGALAQLIDSFRSVSRVVTRGPLNFTCVIYFGRVANPPTILTQWPTLQDQLGESRASGAGVPRAARAGAQSARRGADEARRASGGDRRVSGSRLQIHARKCVS